MGGIIVVIIVDVARAAIRKIKRGREISSLRKSFKEFEIRIKPTLENDSKWFQHVEWFGSFQSQLQSFTLDVTHSENLSANQHRELVRMIDKRLYMFESLSHDQTPMEVYESFFDELKRLRWLGL